MSTEDSFHVVIIGGGLAGLAAAVALSQQGVRVTLCESRVRLGGRASSFVDHETGETIDNCQHVGMGCCTNLQHFCQQTGLSSYFRVDRELTFLGPAGTRTTFRAAPLPAPLHLGPAFCRLPYLSWKEKWLLAQAIRRLATSEARSLTGIPLSLWLDQQKQTPGLIRYVWEVLLVSALSEDLDRIDAGYARKVIVDGFLTHRQGWEVHVPTRPWDTLYSEHVLPFLKSRGVAVKLQCPVERIELSDDGTRVTGVSLKSGDILKADAVILAVAHTRAGNLLPKEDKANQLRDSIQQLESAPITSVHLWYDRPITELPHAVIVGKLSQWLFSKERTPEPGEQSGTDRFGYQIVISASRKLRQLKQHEVVSRVCQELQELFPECTQANLVSTRTVTEHRAVFSPTPGVDRLRPAQQTPWKNLQLAGDWTRTGWPSTMESAVRSGYLAAENLLQGRGDRTGCLQTDLPVSRLSWLCRIRPG